MDERYSHNRSRGQNVRGEGSKPRAYSLQPRSVRRERAAQSRYASRYNAQQAAQQITIRPERPSRLRVDGKLRWEVYFILGVILALGLIVGAGVFIANEKARPAYDRSVTPGVTQAQAASGDSATQTENGAQNSAQSTPKTASLTPEQLAARDTNFAVNPDRAGWNYEQDGRKVVYLTIDDGPSENTAEVLDILDRYGCKATFFVIGRNEDYYNYISEAYKRGHTIGMHTFSHDYGEVYASPESYFADLEAISTVVRDQIGYVPCFVRFPGGSSNDVSVEYYEGMMSLVAEHVQQLGFQYWDWNLSVGDGSVHTAEELVAYGTEPIESDTIVLLCHDGAGKATTVEALPKIIEHYQSQGYVFEALTPESWVCHHEIIN